MEPVGILCQFVNSVNTDIFRFKISLQLGRLDGSAALFCWLLVLSYTYTPIPNLLFFVGTTILIFCLILFFCICILKLRITNLKILLLHLCKIKLWQAFTLPFDAFHCMRFYS
jgi:hypothetical protein